MRMESIFSSSHIKKVELKPTATKENKNKISKYFWYKNIFVFRMLKTTLNIILNNLN